MKVTTPAYLSPRAPFFVAACQESVSVVLILVSPIPQSSTRLINQEPNQEPTQSTAASWQAV